MTFLYYSDIEEMLGVTSTQIEMMVYSGYLPPPSADKCWGQAHIQPFLDNWAKKLARTKPRPDNKNILTGNCTFPRHQQ